MNPLWKVFSNFYSKPERPPSLLSLVWSGADTRSNHRPGWMRRILRRVGKSQAPLQSTKSQLFPVPLQASGLEPAVKAISITSSMLQHEWSLALGGISTAAPDTEQISACMPHCWGPVDMFLHLERWISYEHCGGGSKHLSSLTLRHFQKLCCCVPTQWYQVIKHPRGAVLIFKTPPPTDGILIINWFSAISVWSTAQNSSLI